MLILILYQYLFLWFNKALCGVFNFMVSLDIFKDAKDYLWLNFYKETLRIDR